MTRTTLYANYAYSLCAFPLIFKKTVMYYMDKLYCIHVCILPWILNTQRYNFLQYHVLSNISFQFVSLNHLQLYDGNLKNTYSTLIMLTICNTGQM